MALRNAGPVPVPDSDTDPFWSGCRQRKLLLQRCGSCSRLRFPPSADCPHCASRVHSWIESSGRGTVFSWIVVVHPVPREIYADRVPYVVALVELEQGIRMATNLVECAPEDIVPGMSVEVLFEPISPTISLPKFRPASRHERVA